MSKTPPVRPVTAQLIYRLHLMGFQFHGSQVALDGQMFPRWRAIRLAEYLLTKEALLLGLSNMPPVVKQSPAAGDVNEIETSRPGRPLTEPELVEIDW